MRLGRQKAPVVIDSPAHGEQPRSLVASAARIKLDGQGWPSYKFGDDSWQTEAWRLYDIIGELRFVANWVGAACSKVRIYVAEVDANGRVQQEVEAKGKNKKIAALADSLFGSPAAKAEAIRTMGINLTIAGDVYVIGRSTEDPEYDEWSVLSCSELKRYARTGRIEITDYMGRPETLNTERDIVIRVWTPHPRRNLWADSPTRAALTQLWEIERLTRYVFAQIDSRLISAGMVPIPKEISFPDEDADLTGAEAMTERLMRTASQSLRGEGTAAGVTPIFVEMPTDALGKIELITFGSELSRQAMELRAEALRRFALAMDIDPGILTGVGDANHWGAWQLMEGQIGIHIVPLMTRMCDGFTTSFLKPALKAMKEDPDRYVYWYDTAPLTIRPERGKEAREMYKENIVSREAVIRLNDLKISDIPEDAEDLKLFTRELMLRDPNLFQIPAVREVAGYTEEILPAATVVTPQVPGPGGPGGAGPPPPPAPPTGISPTAGGPIPQETVAQNAPGGPPPAAVTAAAGADPDAYAVANANMFVVANAAVVRAMELVGKRLLDRHQRGAWPGVPAHDLHTRIRTTGKDVEKLLNGAWGHLSVLAEHLDPGLDTSALESTLNDYCFAIITQQQPHLSSTLATVLQRKGFLRGQP